MSFPYDGEIFKAKQRKFKETVFFVHFFEGDKRFLRRHIRTVNTLGFDAFAFTLPIHWNLTKPPLTDDRKFGWKHVYAQVIGELLNQIPGPKIIFAFSNPSASAIEAMAERNCRDTKALICDSGPSGNLLWSTLRLSKQYLVDRSYFKSAIIALLPVTWTPLLHRDLKKHLDLFPEHFPILSIRGWRDPLIPPQHIDAVFDPHPQLLWQKLSLPEASHLNGLRDFRKSYLEGLIPFLKQVATPLD